MKTNIKVSIKSVYGNDLIYPVCDNAKLLAQLLNTKTFTPRQINLLKQLNYKFESVSVIPEALELSFCNI